MNLPMLEVVRRDVALGVELEVDGVVLHADLGISIVTSAGSSSRHRKETGLLRGAVGQCEERVMSDKLATTSRFVKIFVLRTRR